jgi:hypothetical protein
MTPECIANLDKDLRLNLGVAAANPRMTGDSPSILGDDHAGLYQYFMLCVRGLVEKLGFPVSRTSVLEIGKCLEADPKAPLAGVHAYRAASQVMRTAPRAIETSRHQGRRFANAGSPTIL